MNIRTSTEFKLESNQHFHFPIPWFIKNSKHSLHCFDESTEFDFCFDSTNSNSCFYFNVSETVSTNKTNLNILSFNLNSQLIDLQSFPFLDTIRISGNQNNVSLIVKSSISKNISLHLYNISLQTNQIFKEISKRSCIRADTVTFCVCRFFCILYFLYI